MSLIYKSSRLIQEAPSFITSITSSPPKGSTYETPSPWESGFQPMKFLGDTKVETIADTNMNWLILLQWPSATLHCIFISCFTSQPFHTFCLSGFNKAHSVSYQPHLVFSLMFPSPLLSPREPTRESRYVHFCKALSTSLSGSSFLRPCWKQDRG